MGCHPNCPWRVSSKFIKHEDILTFFFPNSGSYSEVAPPHSYINVKDFATPKDLVDYMRYLDRHDEAYISYFWWKPHYKVVTGEDRTFSDVPETLSVCEMCRRLHDPQDPPSQFTGIDDLVTCRHVPPDYWTNRNSSDDSVK